MKFSTISSRFASVIAYFREFTPSRFGTADQEQSSAGSAVLAAVISSGASYMNAAGHCSVAEDGWQAISRCDSRIVEAQLNWQQIPGAILSHSCRDLIYR